MQLWRDNRGQDMIEYALISGLIALVVGAVMPGVAESLSIITSKVNSVLTLSSDNSSGNL